MATTDSMVKCAACGDTVSEARAFIAGRMLDGSAPPDSMVYCSPDCGHEAARRYVNERVKCLVCPKMFVREAGTRGRRKLFHDESCRRNHDASIQRALRSLSKGRNGVPGARSGSVADLTAAIRALETYDAEMMLVARKFRNEGAEDVLVRSVNELRAIAADRMVKARDQLLVANQVARDERENAGQAAGRRRKAEARIAAGEQAISAALAKYGKGA